MRFIEDEQILEIYLRIFLNWFAILQKNLIKVKM